MLCPRYCLIVLEQTLLILVEGMHLDGQAVYLLSKPAAYWPVHAVVDDAQT